VNKRQRRTLGSRVDAPQKPNCQSPEQGLERQRLRRHLPSRLSVRAELRDGNILTCGWIVTLNGSVLMYQVPGVLLYLTSRRGKLKEKGLHAMGQAVEGQETHMQLTKRQATERFTRLVSAKN
jgi:hypothetical protein